MKLVVDIETIRKLHQTSLKKGYAAHPYKLANLGHTPSGEQQLMLMSSSPGILDGDHLKLVLHLGEETSLILSSQSYQRLFTMKNGASQHIEVVMEEGASFTYLPHPSVPHAGSKFSSSNRIYLSKGCRLIWGEVLTCGRKLNGEQFLFDFYHNVTEIFMNKKMVVRENLRVEPLKTAINGIGMLEGYSHQASLLFIHEEAGIADLIEKLYNRLADEKEVCYGVSALPVNGLLVRLLGYKAEQLYNLFQDITTSLLQGKPQTHSSLQTRAHATGY